jgi:microcystin-dependent protein
VALGDLVGETVGGSAQNKAFADYTRGAEFQSILRGYSYLFSSTTTSAGAGGMPVGSVLAYAAAGAPSGWLTCDSTVYSQDQYSALFDVLGRTYGGDATARTFMVPDLRGKTVIGTSPTRAFISVGGSEDAVVVDHDHTGSTGGSSPGTSSSGTHVHGASFPVIYGGGTANPGVLYTSRDIGGTVGVDISPDGDHAHTVNNHSHTIPSQGVDGTGKNMQPFIVLSYVIKAV